MTTTIDNSQRVFMLTGDMNRQIFCNMQDVPTAMADMDDKDTVKIYEFWNSKAKFVSHKKMAEYLKANPVSLPKTVKSISIEALEWLDKVNGNSYFAGRIYVNMGLSDARTLTMPFEYGYGDYYKQAAFKALTEAEYISKSESTIHLWRYCKDSGISFNATLKTAKKSELKAIGS